MVNDSVNIVPGNLQTREGRTNAANQQINSLKNEGIIKEDLDVVYLDKFAIADQADDLSISNTRYFDTREEAFKYIRSGENKDIIRIALAGGTGFKSDDKTRLTKNAVSYIYRLAFNFSYHKMRVRYIDYEGKNSVRLTTMSFSPIETLRHTIVHEAQHAAGHKSEALADRNAYRLLGYPIY